MVNKGRLLGFGENTIHQLARCCSMRLPICFLDTVYIGGDGVEPSETSQSRNFGRPNILMVPFRQQARSHSFSMFPPSSVSYQSLIHLDSLMGARRPGAVP